MDEVLKEMREDIKAIRSDVSDIKVATAVNTTSLVDHMLRTTMNEARIKQVETWLMGFLGTAVLGLISFLAHLALH